MLCMSKQSRHKVTSSAVGMRILTSNIRSSSQSMNTLPPSGSALILWIHIRVMLMTFVSMYLYFYYLLANLSLCCTGVQFWGIRDALILKASMIYRHLTTVIFNGNRKWPKRTIKIFEIPLY